jgi:glycosyltransferase involved in cell wall biosynthesis
LKEDKVTVITCTGDRPEALALCAKYILNQDFFGTIQWIMVDDGKEKMSNIISLPMTVQGTYVRRDSSKDPDDNPTLNLNLKEALKEVNPDSKAIFFIEDDDWYSSHYLSTMYVKIRSGFSLVGESEAVYYHVGARKIAYLTNDSQASLSQTAIDISLLPVFTDLVTQNKHPFIDLFLWKYKVSRFLFTHPNKRGWMSVGIKGMPGRRGIGVGHRKNFSEYEDDPNLEKLQSLIGEDVKHYTKYYEKGVLDK